MVERKEGTACVTKARARLRHSWLWLASTVTSLQSEISKRMLLHPKVLDDPLGGILQNSLSIGLVQVIEDPVRWG